MEGESELAVRFPELDVANLTTERGNFAPHLA